MEEVKEKSKGEQIVRVDFNVTNSGTVGYFKDTTAEIINTIEANRELDPRLAAIAITKYEEAVIWAVKLATVKL